MKISKVIYRCLECGGGMTLDVLQARCLACGKIVLKNSNGSLVFVGASEGAVSDSLDKIKLNLKKLGKLYNFLISLVSPVLPIPNKEVKKFLRNKHTADSVILNLGSGSSSIDPRVINIDFLPYSEVDIVCSISNLPIADNSVDAIINIAVLEHVPNPTKVVDEFFRVLKPTAQIYCFIPFVQGFHASPWDFQRFTKSGMQELFKEFSIEEIIPVGPTSGLLWVLQEWLATVLSFGSRKLHLTIWLVLIATTWPLKYLDILFRWYPTAENITTGFLIKASKPSI